MIYFKIIDLCCGPTIQIFQLFLRRFKLFKNLKFLRDLFILIVVIDEIDVIFHLLQKTANRNFNSN